ncbi:MAG TPA: aminotransferase class IV [Solirubrobacteraceae bacterium]|jgi:branched-chain amino acid aminotransferase|nr:aminotransferase class IV [Solirubrobacteraceae bacterium]
MPSGLACIDGVLVQLADARIPVDDHGLLRGDGVFEAIRLYDGRPFALDRHLERMRRSAAGLRLPLDVDAVRGDVERMLKARADGDDILRVLATRGGRRITLFEALPPERESCSLGCVTYAPVRVLDQIKSLSYAANMLAARLAQERGFDDALLVSPHGRVLECPTASFFAIAGGVIRTPPLSDHVLDSITRQILIEVADVREEPITVDDLAVLDEAFVASSVRDVLAVNRIDERELAAPGVLTSAVAARFRERTAADLGR